MFELRRFGRLAAVLWAENGRGYLWFLGIGVLVHFCVWLLLTQGGSRPEQYDDGLQTATYCGGYLMTAVLFAGRHFSALSRRESALTYLMRPASALEKTLLAFLLVAVAYPLAYTVAFQVCNLPGAWVGDAARDALLAAPGKDSNALYLKNRQYGPYLPFTDPKTPAWEWNLFLGTAAIQALVVAGLLFFRKAAGLKTLVAMFQLFVVAIPLLSSASGAVPFRLFLGTPVPPGHPGLQAWIWVLWIGVPALFWASAWCLLRERELQ